MRGHDVQLAPGHNAAARVLLVIRFGHEYLGARVDNYMGTLRAARRRRHRDNRLAGRKQPTHVAT